MSSLSRLLPTVEHERWVREMTKLGLDFKNPVGLSAFNCFKDVCIMERNTAEIGRMSEPTLTQSSSKNKNKSSFSAQQVNYYSSGDKQESVTVQSASAAPAPVRSKQWSYPKSLKYPCTIANHKHEITTCAEYFAFSHVERWTKIDKRRICFCCLKPRSICLLRKCSNEATVPEVLKCSVCAEWARAIPKGMAPFSILYCKKQEHGETRAPLSEIKANLEKYLGK